MARYIDTDVKVNARRQGGQNVQGKGYSREQIVGKSGIEQLAGVLSAVNPKITQVAKKGIDQTNEAYFEEGKASISGLSLEQAQELSKKGFPDLYNDWARYGASVQYASNATNEFVLGFKQQYLQNREDPNFNWREAWGVARDEFLKDKQGDRIFNKVLNSANAEFEKWVNVQEFQRQSAEFAANVNSNTTHEISQIPTKIFDKMLVDFYEQAKITDLNKKDYGVKQEEFFRKNASKYFNDEFQRLKQTKNASLSKSDFDDLVLSAGRLHAQQGGNMATNFIELITKPRPDGTPPIISNPKKIKEAVAVVKLLQDAENVNKFAVNFLRGNSSQYSDSDFKKLGDGLFNNSVKRYMNFNGGNRKMAVSQTMIDLGTGLKTGRPIKKIKEILEAPIGTQSSNDNEIALEVYMQLEKRGAVGNYFETQNKNSIKWFMVGTMVKNGVDPKEAITRVGQWEGNTTRKFETLTAEDRKAVMDAVGIKSDSQHMELMMNLATYFKNVAGRDGDYKNLTKDFFQQHYEKIPNSERYVSKNYLSELGITSDNFDPMVDHFKNMLRDKYKDLPELFRQKPTKKPYGEIDANPEDPFQYDINKYDISIDAKNNKIFLVRKDNPFGMVEYEVITDKKTGLTSYATLPLDAVVKSYNDKIKKEIEERRKQSEIERKKEVERRKKIKKATDEYFGGGS